MASPIEVQLILCDAAQAEAGTGKVHMLGAGWSRTTTPFTHAVAVLAKVPWDRANQRFALTLTLREQDGPPVVLSTPDGPREIRAEGNIEVGRPAGLLAGSPLDASFALNVSPLPLKAGRYYWQLELAEEIRSAGFTVEDAPGQHL
ncbi:hypothetical protein HH310_28380 [Actinoplanes sp. TBRC 11911]|uniref:DUF6941 family protein n=1 Tax=Actinoplanes sp. TBRC 11911 TaxID=2729386 RepID=UPI00145F6218|nr:hypothetical protein [Actinoplanes sp. TBRC 11911]NMO55091.1 hypothetical protein [Actinoplanes sp. TBRC 11911]